MTTAIIMWVSRYLMVGVVVAIMFDWLVKRISNQEFTNGERVAMILLWPLMIVSFIIGWLGGNRGE